MLEVLQVVAEREMSVDFSLTLMLSNYDTRGRESKLCAVCVFYLKPNKANCINYIKIHYSRCIY